MKLRTRLTIALIGVITLFMMTTANATWDKDCDHPRFLEKGCGYEGKDGKDGRNGKDGVDGRDGKDGVDGRDGIDGKDGVVSETWIKETRTNFREWSHYAAAMQAIQIHLPQDRGSRLTLAGSTINGVKGLGLGYAYKMDRDDNLSFTVGLGSSGGEEVGVISAGFEFGGSRHNNLKSVQHNNLKSVERRLDVMEQDFQRQRAVWDEDAKRCAADLENEENRSGNIERKFMECLGK